MILYASFPRARIVWGMFYKRLHHLFEDFIANILGWECMHVCAVSYALREILLVENART